MIAVRQATAADADAWRRMRSALWPGGDEDHARDVTQFFAGDLRNPLAVLVAVDRSAGHVGFAELSIRNYAEACVTDRVAYLEGWYVEPPWRRSGVGRALIEAAEAWARDRGCTEWGSDAAIDNDVSTRAHSAVGFAETAQIRTFRKAL